MEKLYELRISELDKAALGVLDSPTNQQALDVISDLSEEQITEVSADESSTAGRTIDKDALDILIDYLERKQDIKRILDCGDTQEALRIIDSSKRENSRV